MEPPSFFISQGQGAFLCSRAGLDMRESGMHHIQQKTAGCPKGQSAVLRQWEYQDSTSRIDLVKLAAVRKMVSGWIRSSYSAGLTI